MMTDHDAPRPLSPSVRKATRADAESVSTSLASAFSTDPVLLWILGREDDAERRLRVYFNGACRITLKKPDHEIHLTEDGFGAALWFGIDNWKVAPSDLARVFPSVVRAWGMGFFRGLKLLSAMEKVHPTEPHYYLEFLGTRHDRQGHGVGNALLTSMLERCDREGVGAYLENSNPKNTPLYARHGFAARGSIALPKGCPPMLPMWREPRV